MGSWRKGLTAGLVLVAMTTTAAARADEGPLFGIDDSSTRGWFRGAGLGGASLIYASCLLAGYVSLEDGNEELAPMMIPVVGPIVTTATTDASDEGDALMYTLSSLQAAGLLVFGLSFLGDEDAPSYPELTFAPRLSPTAAGMQLGVSF